MRALLTGLLLAGLVLAPPLCAQDVDPAQHVFVELAADPDLTYVEQAVVLKFRVGVEAGFAEEHLVQSLRQRFDLPVRVEAPWLSRLDGARVMPAEGSPEPGISFVLNGERAVGRGAEAVLRDGRRFRVMEYRRRILPTRVGALITPEVGLGFSFATRFRDDFVQGRVPEDSREVRLRGDGLRLQVRPLPVTGRPANFIGAVGSFAMTADVEPRQLALGESLKLRLRFEGGGNLELFEPPRLDGLDGFYLLGRIEERGVGWRAFVYDLVPLRKDVKAVPALEFAFFDPGPPSGYRQLASTAIPIEVGPGELVGLPVVPEVQALVAGVDDIHDDIDWFDADLRWTLFDNRGQPTDDDLVRWLLLPWLFVFPVLMFVVVGARARDVVGMKAVTAARTARRQLGRGEPVEGVYREFLASRLRCGPSVVVGPDLRDRLMAAGLEEDLANRAERVLDELSAERFGGGGGVPERDAVRSMIVEIDRSIRRREVLR